MPERYGRLPEVTSCVVDITKLELPGSHAVFMAGFVESSFWNRTIGKCEMIVSPRLSLDDRRTRFGTNCTETRLFERTHGGFAP
jgi:hypothetical protein